MTDDELIEWIKQVNPGEQVPKDTGPRVLRLLQTLVERLEVIEANGVIETKRKPGRPKLSLNKTA